MVSQDGGMPTAWVENLGNDLASLNIQLTGLPSGWTYIGPDAMVVAPSQILGIPFTLIPESSWDGQSFVVTIEVEHPSLGIYSIPISVENSSSSFASTPIVSGISDRNISIDFNGNVTLDSLQSSISYTQQNGKITLLIPDSRVNLSLFDQGNPESEYIIHIVGQTLPDISGNCQLNSAAFETLGLTTISGSVGSCSLTSSSDERLRGSFVLITNTGEQIPITQSSVNMAESTTESFSINLSSWSTDAGYVDITLMFIDSYGRVIDEESVSVISRSSGWNIGISSVESDGDITVGISRESATYQRLIGVTCKLMITKSQDVLVATVIVDIGGSEYAPVIVVKDPGNIDDGEQIKATIGCNAPFDIDENPNDDTKSADYNEESTIKVSGDDILITVMVAGILIVIAFFAGLLQIKDEKELPKSTDLEIKQIEKVVEVEEEIDDINFEFEEEIIEQNNEVIDLDDDEPISMEETVVEEPDNSPSGRLASLRDELDDDKVIERRPLRDRMDDFFND